MKKELSLFLIAISLWFDAFPQITSAIETIENKILTPSDMMIGRKLPPPETKGDFFYETEWQSAVIHLRNGQDIKNYPVRYDLENKLFEIKVDEKIKILKGNAVKSYEWLHFQYQQSESFVNAEDYEFEGTKLLGFYKVLVSGDVSLLSMRKTKIKKPTYVEGIDVGSRDNEILKYDEFYVAKEGKVFQLTNNRKKDGAFLEELTGEKELDKYMKQNKLGTKKEKDLVQLFEYLNR
ncbi:hypothetical protein R9C00_08300 [Flammeovirgaceae bacterium SG7u.111]|nr:hypothetical protein [Flammeovirgaceae bacterium SG7u.132]WPO37448.1 hypothetical protein R9C00_08300 [Flammeovirgaceae bacterium SG7u.111]